MIMSKKDKRWYTYSTEVGDIEIKVSKSIPVNESGIFMFRYMRPDEIDWRYFSPNKEFKDVFHLISHITRNVELAKTRFKIVSLQPKLESPFDEDG